MESIKSRPVVTCEELCAAGSPYGAPRKALLTAGEFLKMVRVISGHSLSRRTLQLYSSPGLRLLPLPIHFRGNTAHYLHPEHTVRCALLLHLREAYFLPLNLVKEVLDAVSDEHCDLILSGVLSAQDLIRLARDGAKAWLKEALVGRAARSLEAARVLGKTIEQAGEPVSMVSALAERGRAEGRVPALAGGR
ncbi:MAG: hypothetical protein KGO96_00870 [Elusimicrobia bacterium]|nr:hypothetical protein [Elusimicrobiota bacterium]MDE2424447.1 hypothetical protein [Elusimicrobiota bacterium]